MAAKPKNVAARSVRCAAARVCSARWVVENTGLSDLYMHGCFWKPGIAKQYYFVRCICTSRVTAGGGVALKSETCVIIGPAYMIGAIILKLRTIIQSVFYSRLSM